MNASRLINGLGFGRFSGLYLWAGFIITFSIWTPHLFLTTSTLYSVGDSQAIAAMVGIAISIPLAAGVFDLSVGANIGFCAILAVWMQNEHHVAVGPAIVLTVLAALVIGAVNGFIVVVLRVNSFIATLGTSAVIAAFQTITTGGGQPLPPTSTAWAQLSQRQLGGTLQIVVIYLLALTIIAWWALEHTAVGRYLYAIGGNPDAARLSGVNVKTWTWLSLIASAGISGLAGVFYASQNGPSLTFGPALLLPAFSAAFLGSTQFKPGRVNIWGTVVAVYVLATGVAGLQLVTGVQWLPDMFNGVALVSAVAFAGWSQLRSPARRNEKAEAGPDIPLEPEPDPRVEPSPA